MYKFTNQPDIPEITHIDKSAIPPPIVASRLLKNLKLSSFVLSESKVDYVFVLQPALAVTNKRLTKREQAGLKDKDYFRQCYALFDMMLKAFHSEHFQYVNLSEIFDRFGDREEIFLDSYHFGDKGNEIIAENIYLQVKERIAR